MDRLELYYGDVGVGLSPFFVSPAFAPGVGPPWNIPIFAFSAAAATALSNGLVYIGFRNLNDDIVSTIRLDETEVLEQSGSFEQTGDRGRFRVTYFAPSLTGLNTSSPAYRFACVETRRSSNGGQITGLVETTIDGAREFIAVTELSAVALSETLLGFGCGRIAVDATDHDPTVEIRVASSGGQYVSGEPCNARPDQVTGTQPSPSVCVGPDDRTFQVALRWAGPFAPAQAFQATRERAVSSLRRQRVPGCSARSGAGYSARPGD